jgi:hypothetical protein
MTRVTNQHLVTLAAGLKLKKRLRIGEPAAEASQVCRHMRFPATMPAMPMTITVVGIAPEGTHDVPSVYFSMDGKA